MCMLWCKKTGLNRETLARSFQKRTPGGFYFQCWCVWRVVCSLSQAKNMRVLGWGLVNIGMMYAFYLSLTTCVSFLGQRFVWSYCLFRLKAKMHVWERKRNRKSGRCDIVPRYFRKAKTISSCMWQTWLYENAYLLNLKPPCGSFFFFFFRFVKLCFSMFWILCDFRFVLRKHVVAAKTRPETSRNWEHVKIIHKLKKKKRLRMNQRLVFIVYWNWKCIFNAMIYSSFTRSNPCFPKIA